MNFVQLLFELQLENEKFSKYREADFIKFEKRIKVEKQINTEISSEISEKLLKAIKEFPQELEEFVKKKSLVNVFLGIEPRVNYYKLFVHPNFKDFFKKYLEDDLSYIIKRKVAKKDYASLEKMMQYKTYFSLDFVDDLQETFENKLSYANDFYANRAFIKHVEYDFLMNKHFFRFINHLNNYSTESYLSDIYNKVVDEFNNTKQLRHPLHALIAYSYYKPEDDEFRQIVRQNKNYAHDRLKELKSSSGGWQSIGTILVVLFFIIRIAVIANRSSSPSYTVPRPNHEILNNDYLRSVYFNINNTLGKKERKIIHYIQDNEVDETFKPKLVKNIKTGDVPFDINLPEFNIDSYKQFTIVNNSKHDLIVLEYEMLNLKNSIKKKHTIFENIRFIKSKDSLKMSNYDDFENTLFSFYLGDSLSTYRNPFQSATREMFKKDRITRESRFLHPIKGTKNTLNTYFKLQNRTVLTKGKDMLHVKSLDLKYNINGISIFVKQNYYNINLKEELMLLNK